VKVVSGEGGSGEERAGGWTTESKQFMRERRPACVCVCVCVCACWIPSALSIPLA
jgi:hypothetical protein